MVANAIVAMDLCLCGVSAVKLSQKLQQCRGDIYEYVYEAVRVSNMFLTLHVVKTGFVSLVYSDQGQREGDGETFTQILGVSRKQFFRSI
jgi:hypothetical protein